ncbi:MAG: fatty acid desaturase [Gemmatimonadaceae bacterium]
MTSLSLAPESAPPSRNASTEEARRWQQQAARFRARSTGRAIAELATTVLPLLALFVLMYLSLDYSYWLTLALAIPTAGFHVRTFIIMHDCAHGSFTPNKTANELIGTATGFASLTPFAQWRREHAIHHASSGDLDRRGHGDIDTLTVREYLALSPAQRFKYRIVRNPLILLIFGPIFLFITHRLPLSAGQRSQHAFSVMVTNVVIVACLVLAHYTIGIGTLLAVFVPVTLMAGAMGIWLFYVQHQFEGAYWERHEAWDYATAAMRGSSYYRLPRVLEWMTGSIGLHHIHHLDPKIPSYRLRRCHDSTPEFRNIPELTIRQSLKSIGLNLWDEEEKRLIGFRYLHRRLRAG